MVSYLTLTSCSTLPKIIILGWKHLTFSAFWQRWAEAPEVETNSERLIPVHQGLKGSHMLIIITRKNIYFCPSHFSLGFYWTPFNRNLFQYMNASCSAFTRINKTQSYITGGFDHSCCRLLGAAVSARVKPWSCVSLMSCKLKWLFRVLAAFVLQLFELYFSIKMLVHLMWGQISPAPLLKMKVSEKFVTVSAVSPSVCWTQGPSCWNCFFIPKMPGRFFFVCVGFGRTCLRGDF